MTPKSPIATGWIAALAALALLAGSIYAGWGWVDAERRAAELRDSGVETTGTVLDISMSAGSTSKTGVMTPARYYITYAFTDSLGVPHEAMSNGTGTAYSELAVGQPIPVRFLRGDPGVNIYDRNTPSMNATPLAVVALCAGLAALFGAYAWRSLRRTPVVR